MRPAMAARVASRLAQHATALAAARPDAGATDAWFVPGRIEVLGKHTDYGGGRSLICAVERGLCAVSAARADGRVVITDRRRGLTITVEPDGAAPSLSWANYPNTVVERLKRNFPGAVRGVDIVFDSDLPSASGMSSSSALMVLVLLAVSRASRLDARDEWRRAIGNEEDLAAYAATIENGSGFGGLAGERGVGTRGGSEDHTAILCSEPDRLGQYLVPADTARAPGGAARRLDLRDRRQRRAGTEDRQRTRVLQPRRRTRVARRRALAAGVWPGRRDPRGGGGERARSRGADPRPAHRTGTPRSFRSVHRGEQRARTGRDGLHRARRRKGIGRHRRAIADAGGIPAGEPGAANRRAGAARARARGRSRPRRSAPGSAAASGRSSTRRPRRAFSIDGRMHTAARFQRVRPRRRSFSRARALARTWSKFSRAGRKPRPTTT